MKGSLILDKLKKYGIRENKIDYSKYHEYRPNSQMIFEIIKKLCSEIGNIITLIGGQTAHPNLLGYRKMRKSSNDIDCVVYEEFLDALCKKFVGNENFFYCPEYGILFLEFSKLPVGFFLKKIHDWKIPKDFFNSKIKINLEDIVINVAAPEYTIMLKIRRWYKRGRVFGKDRIDIANLLLASHYKPKVTPINLEKISALIKENVTSRIEEVLPYLEDLKKVSTHLKKGEEREIFQELLIHLIKLVKKH